MDPYRETLLMLDACNLSGLGHSFSKEVLPAIWEEVRARGGGTDQVNRHPLSVLWTMKMASLAYPECLCASCVEAFRQAYEDLKKRVQQGETG
jgi:hypothetical protein